MCEECGQLRARFCCELQLVGLDGVKTEEEEAGIIEEEQNDRSEEHCDWQH